MDKRILIATQNLAKAKEIITGLQELQDLGYTFYTTHDLHIDAEPEEIGKTFKENVLIKAKFYAAKAKMPVISDDGGIVIDALNGEPGVYSKRWMGRPATDEELIEYTLKRMEGIPEEKRTAELTGCVCYFDPISNIALYSEVGIKGHIAYKPTDTRIAGFPYRSVFVVNEFSKFYTDLTPEEHEKVNHRQKAVKEIIEKIKNRE